MRFYSLALRNFKEIYRDPITILLGILLPAGMLFLFANLFKDAGLQQFSVQYFTPSMVIFSFTFIIMFSAILLARDKEQAFLIRLFTTPLSIVDYILAYVSAFLPLAIIQISTCLILGSILGANYQHLIFISLIFMLIAFICINLGLTLGALFNVNQASGIGSLLITVLGLISGVWLDLEMLGGTIAKIGYALPFSHAISLVNALIHDTFDLSSIHSLLIILIYIAASFIVAVLAFRRCMQRV